jgi:asparagine synthase (glutamine-hydrolysing)
MFAFAIAERDSGRVFLARDRFGIKPLYLAELAGGLRFASTLPALLAAGDVDTQIDPIALHHYLTFHAVVPAPHTILQGVRKLAPGSWLSIEADGERTSGSYFSLEFQAQPEEVGLGFEDFEAKVLDALRLAVRRRLVADVPVGVLLSGGLDSSLLVALLAEAGQHGLETFSVGFESVRGEAGDEFAYSDLIAKRFETRHHRIFAKAQQVLDALPRAIAAMSEPMVSHDAVGFFLLSQEVSRHVKVVQSGQGADEVFAGYHWYPPLLASGDGPRDYAEVFFDRSHAEMSEVLADGLLGADHSRMFVERHFAKPGATQVIDRALRLDTEVMLVDDPVKRVDNMTMAFGLEARVPFLDHELVQLAARVPAEMKLRDGGKGILKALARKLVPAEVIDRPKGYFPVPALKFLRGPYLESVRDVLHSARARQRGLFRPAYLEKLFLDPEAHVTRLRGSKLWQLGLLESWLQAQGV